MSTPNMSGRTDAPSTDTADHVDPSDLLDDDGTIDIGAVKSLTNRRAAKPEQVSEAECARIRERLAAESTQTSAVAADLGYGSTAIRNHAKGDCGCRHGTPIVAYDGSEWVRADE